MRPRAWLWGSVGVLLVAAALRLMAFGQLPPGLYHDEAYNGLDALDVLQGRPSLYFEANNGREPLFIYLVTLAVGLFGRSPFAVRLPALFVGILTVAATCAMGQALFSRRVGLLAAAILAVTLWHVHLSRVSLRAVLLPLLLALALWQAAWGIRTGRGGHWLAAGALYGLCFYSYSAARFTPVALAIFAVYWLAVRRNAPAPHPAPSGLLRGVGLGVLALLVVVAPLGVYTIFHPDIVLGRPGQVSIANPAIHQGDFWGTLGRHTLRTLGMFFVRGDRIWRHNVPWRPVFDPLLGVAFVAGLWVGVRRLRRDLAWGFVLLWTAVMLLPTLLAEDAPHFLRAVGILPVAVLLPAGGLSYLSDWAARLAGRLGPSARVGRSKRWIQRLALALPLAFALGSTARAYFGQYARDPMTGYWFERGAVVLAGQINAFLGVGWDGAHMRHGAPGARRVYLEPRLWTGWPQVRFLVAAPEAVAVGLDGQAAAEPVAVFVWPYSEWQRAWKLLPVPAEVTVELGPLSQGDRDPEPYRTYLAFRGTPPGPAGPALAAFAGGIELLGATVSSAGDGDLQVLLRWRASAPLDQDYTAFVHYLRDGERIAQADARPASGYYPTLSWQSGDIVNDHHVIAGVEDSIPGRDVLVVGLWQPETGAQLDRLDEAGNPAGTSVEVPVLEGAEGRDAR